MFPLSCDALVQKKVMSVDERLNKVEQREKSLNTAQQDRTNQKATVIRIFTVVLQNFKQSSNGMIVKNYSQLTR